MNNYKILDLLSVLLKRELLYQNNYIYLQDVKFYLTSIVLIERDSDIEFTSLGALYTFLSNCLPTSDLQTDRDIVALSNQFKASCMLEEPKELIKLSINQMKTTQKKAAKTTNKKVATKKEKAVEQKSTFLRQKEATELYNASRYKVRRLGEKQTDSTLFYKDEEGVPFYSTVLLDANFEKREVNQIGVELDGKEIAKKVKTINELTKEEKIKAKLGFDANELQENTNKAFVKGEVKDFTPNDDDTGEYCQIESSDVDLLEKVELEEKDENNQENLSNLLFYKTIFGNFEDLQHTKDELVKWQKRTAETNNPLTTEEKERFSVFIQATRAYTSLLKIEQKSILIKNND